MDSALRPARVVDLDRINEIYNHFVLHSTCTYQETPETMASRQAWFDRHGPQHPVVVAEVDGRVVGWGALSAFHERSAYRFSTENSVYVDPAWHRHGIGRQILDDLITRARSLGYRTIVAGIDASQTASVALHRSCGFEKVSHFREVGFKFGQWLDVVHMQLWI